MSNWLPLGHLPCWLILLISARDPPYIKSKSIQCNETMTCYWFFREFWQNIKLSDVFWWCIHSLIKSKTRSEFWKTSEKECIQYRRSICTTLSTVKREFYSTYWNKSETLSKRCSMNKNRYLALLSFYRNLSSILKSNFKELYLSSFLYPISSNVKRNISFLDRLKNKYTIAVKNLLFSIGFFLTVDRDMNWLMVQYTAPKCQTLINIYVLRASLLNFPSLKSNLSLM